MGMLKAATGRVILTGAQLLEIPLAFCSAGFSGADVTILPQAWTICTVTWTRAPVLSTLAVQNRDLLLKLLELRSVRTSWNNTVVSGADRRREHG